MKHAYMLLFDKEYCFQVHASVFKAFVRVEEERRRHIARVTVEPHYFL